MGHIQGCSRYCSQYYDARAGPERLTSCATLVAVTVEVWFHLSRSVFWAEIWCQFQADYGDRAIEMDPGMLQALQPTL